MFALRNFVRPSLIFALAVMLANTICVPAFASIEHRVAFKVEGTVILWGETHTAADIQQSVEFQSADDLIQPVSYDAPIATTGTLVPIAAANLLAANAFPLAQSETSGHTFYVASNTAFNIRSDVSAVSEGLRDTVNVDISVSAGQGHYGKSAQLPHTTNNGVTAGIHTLRDMQASPVIYSGTRKTAVRPGSIADQSVRFDIEYTASADENHARAFASQDVVYTVYIP